MTPKFQFIIYNDVLYPDGIMVNTPIGWKDSALSLNRDKVFQSLIEEFKGSFLWWGRARTVLLEIEALGIDAIARLVVRIAYSGDYEDMFEGTFDLPQLQEIPFKDKDYKLDIPIIRDDFWAKFINRFKTAVDIQSERDLYNNIRTVLAPTTLTLTSQKVNQRYTAESGADLPSLIVATFDGLDNTNYGSVDVFGDVSLDEVTDKLSPANDISSAPKPLFKFTFAGNYQIDCKIFLWGDAGATNWANADISINLQRNNGAPIPFTRTDYGTDGVDGVSGFELSENMEMQSGDIIYIYIRNSEATTGTPASVFVPGKPSSYPSAGGPLISTLDIFAITTFPNSGAQSMRIHEMLQSILDRIIGADETLYSEYFGRTDTLPTPYAADGCGSAYALLKGAHIRTKTFDTKPFAESAEEFNNGANPLFNIGWSYERIAVENFVNFLFNSLFDPSMENPAQVWWYTTGPGTAPWLDPWAETTLIGPSGESDLLQQDFTLKPIGDYRLAFTNALNAGGPATFNVLVKLKKLGVVIQTIYNDDVVIPDTVADILTSQDFTALDSFDNIEIKITFVSSAGNIEAIFKRVELQQKFGTKKVIRVEKKEYFFKDDISVNFSNLVGVKRRYDLEKVFKSTGNGFAEWSIESASGIDDVQTKAWRYTRFPTIGTVWEMFSTWFGASLGIEQARRFQDATKDFSLDDKTVIIALNKETMDKPELDENFDSITGLLNPETRYNTRLSPARIFLRWRNWFSGCLIDGARRDFYFSKGEGNNSMISTLSASDCEGDGEPLAENDMIENGDAPLFTPGVWEFDTPMQHAQYKLIVAARDKAIGVSKTATGHVPASILNHDWFYMKGSGKFIVLIKSTI